MEIDAFLADSVDTVNGKIYAHGAGWNVLYAHRIPTAHPRIGIGMLIRVPYTATDQPHELQIRLEDADGRPIALGRDGPDPDAVRFGLTASFSVGRPPDLIPGDEQIVPLSVNLDGLVFEQATSYRFVLSIDGHDRKRIPVRVVHRPLGRPE